MIQLDRSFVAAYRELGAIYMKSGRFDEAITIFAQAVALDDSSADTHNSLGSALASVGKSTAAIESFRKAAELDPNLASAWYNLAVLYHQLGAVEQAGSPAQRLRPRSREAQGGPIS